MKHSEKLAPAAAMTAALFSISCCIPFGITAALGLAGISMFASKYQLGLIIASVLLLIAGVIQLVRKPACQHRSRTSIVLLCISAVLVTAVTVFPQSIASFMADHLP